VELATDEVIDAFPLKHQRNFINAVVHVLLFNYRLEGNVTEDGDFAPEILV
jgi:hypothetical protein